MVVTAGILRVMGVGSPITVTINLKNHRPPVGSLDFSIAVCSQREIITLKEPAVQCKGTRVTRELWCENHCFRETKNIWDTWDASELKPCLPLLLFIIFFEVSRMILCVQFGVICFGT